MGISFHGTHAMAVGGSAPVPGESPLGPRLTLLSTDSGRTWHVVNLRAHIPAPFFRVRWIGPTTTLALAMRRSSDGGAYTGIWRTTDSGRRWIPVLIGQVTGYAFLSRTDLWAVVNGVLMHSTDGGLLWNPVPAATSYPVLAMDLSPTSGNITVDLGVNAALYRTTNDGRDWTKLGWVPTTGTIHWLNDRVGFYGNGSRLWATRDAGRRWHSVPLPAAMDRGNFESTYWITSEVGYLAVRTWNAVHSLYRTTNGGRRWERIAHLPEFNTLSFVNGQDGLDNAINRWGVTTDGGRHWTWHLVSSNDIIEAGAWEPHGPIWLYVYVMGVGNRLWLVSPTGFPQRRVLALSPEMDVKAVSFINSEDGWLTGNGLVLETTNGGSRWRIIRTPASTTPISGTPAAPLTPHRTRP
jgi:photosystem II stability/assembly factor-like uncharacterized protein